MLLWLPSSIRIPANPLFLPPQLVIRLLLLPVASQPVSGPHPRRIPTSPLFSVPLQSRMTLFVERISHSPTLLLPAIEAVPIRLPSDESSTTPAFVLNWVSKLLRRQ